MRGDDYRASEMESPSTRAAWFGLCPAGGTSRTVVLVRVRLWRLRLGLPGCYLRLSAAARVVESLFTYVVESLFTYLDSNAAS